MNFVRRRSFNLTRFYRIFIRRLILLLWLKFYRKLKSLNDTLFKDFDLEEALRFLRSKMDRLRLMWEMQKKFEKNIKRKTLRIKLKVLGLIKVLWQSEKAKLFSHQVFIDLIIAFQNALNHTYKDTLKLKNKKSLIQSKE